jgi:hypothetical protein
MAAKGVNLLPEDDDSQDKQENEDDFDDELDFEERIRSRTRGPSDEGGGFLRILGIVFAIVVLFASVSWAGYQFWWIPRVEKEQKKIEARQRLEQLRKNRLEQANAERERRKKELALLQKIRKEAEEKVKEKGMATSAQQNGPQEKPVAAQEGVKKQPGDSKKKVASKASPPQAAKKVSGTPAQEIQPEKKAMMKPSEAMKRPAVKPVKRAQAAPKPPAEKKEPAPKKSSPKKPTADSMAKAKKGKKAPAVNSMVKAGKKKEAPLPKAMGGPAEPPKSRSFYTVQVATCRTAKCAKAFSRKLRQKGFQPIVLKRGGASGARTEVLLDEVPSKDRADSLAALAREKKLKVTVYQSGKVWRVSAGSFSNMEDAAQRLDQVEDAGMKAKLSARPKSTRSKFQVVGTGRLSNRKSAIDMRRRVLKAGFKDSFVVLRRSQ